MDYTKLNVWLETKTLVNMIYKSSKTFPKDEMFGLTNQIRRAAVSIPSNIAEGCGRQRTNDTIHFLHIARGSLYEVETQCFIAADQNYIEHKTLVELSVHVQQCKKLLNGFINYYRKL